MTSRLIFKWPWSNVAVLNKKEMQQYHFLLSLLWTVTFLLQPFWKYVALQRDSYCICLIQIFQWFQAVLFFIYSQQDSQEFLIYLLEGLHEDVNRVLEKKKQMIKEEEGEEKIR